MAESWHVAAFKQRHHKESPEACARRALKLLSALRQLDPCFEHFRYARRVRGKQIMEELTLDLGQLTELFARGVNRNDTDRAVIEDLGFSISVVTPGKNNSWLMIWVRLFQNTRIWKAAIT